MFKKILKKVKEDEIYYEQKNPSNSLAVFTGAESPVYHENKNPEFKIDFKKTNLFLYSNKHLSSYIDHDNSRVLVLDTQRLKQEKTFYPLIDKIIISSRDGIKKDLLISNKEHNYKIYGHPIKEKCDEIDLFHIVILLFNGNSEILSQVISFNFINLGLDRKGIPFHEDIYFLRSIYQCIEYFSGETFATSIFKDLKLSSNILEL